MTIRAEHESLAEYLSTHLSPDELERPLLVSFTQWDFAAAALAEVAATLHAMGSRPSVALWSSKTPLRDVGWQSHHMISRLFLSPTIDIRVKQALLAFGLPKSTFVDPYRPWTPREPLPTITDTNRSAIRALTYRGAPMGRGILEVPPSSETPVTDEYRWPHRYVERAIRSYAFAFDQAMQAMEDSRASAVFTYNGRFLHDSAVAHAAEQLGLPTLAYDTGGLETDFDLTIDATHDWSALQKRMKRMYESWPRAEADTVGSSWFLDRRNHTEAANTMFTGGQTLGQGIDVAPNETLVTYFSSSGDEIAELDLDWADFFDGQEEAVKAVADACAAHGYRFVVRTHPHKRFKPADDVAAWHRAVQRANPDVHLDEHSEVDSYTLMEQSDVVVTYGSTTGVEAAFAGRPVIVMGPSAYDELGCALRVRDRQQLTDAIANPPTPSSTSAIPYGLMMKRRGFTYEYISRDDSGGRQLAGVPIIEPRMLVRHVSHAVNRQTKRRLNA